MKLVKFLNQNRKLKNIVAMIDLRHIHIKVHMRATGVKATIRIYLEYMSYKMVFNSGFCLVVVDIKRRAINPKIITETTVDCGVSLDLIKTINY